MQNNTENTQNQKPGRPDGLSLICSLSFIGGGLSFISNFFIYALYTQLISAIENEEIVTLFDMDYEMLLNLLEATGRLYYLIIAMVYLVSLYGVYLMWNLRKVGIHFYAIAQIVLLILPLIYLNTGASVFPSLLITALFILIYARYHKIMN